nr:hypothetical protein [Cryobacterium sp. Y11]
MVNSTAKRGLGFILLATVLGGLAGYAVQAVVLSQLHPAAYLEFSVFWSALYLVISGLAGIQQEVTRATRFGVRRQENKSNTARNFGALTSLALFGAIVSLGPLWGPIVFGDAWSWSLVIALAVGSASYVVVAVFCGTMYGLQQWRTLAVMISCDALLRLAFIGIFLSFTGASELLPWAVVLPFPLTVLVVWATVRKHTRGSAILDVNLKSLAWNSARTVSGSVATGILISGFPLFLSLASRNDSAAAVGTLIAVVTLTRAPLIIPFLALQSYLLVFFRDHTANFWRAFGLIIGAIAAATTVASGLAWWLGPALLDLFGPEYAVDSSTAGLLVASAGFTAALCASGPAVLARNGHTAYSVGWTAAAVSVVALLFLPIDLNSRSILALAVGPALGLVVHVIYLVRTSRAIPVPCPPKRQ